MTNKAKNKSKLYKRLPASGESFAAFCKLCLLVLGSGGAGLGLAIAKEITELHGGSISAKGQDNQIEFDVRLPA